ncbi:MAG: DUF1906 domain-containing protein [Parvularculaceae bacterium]|nr:DUF1906 domain-containing protein [Parvularculaceae bacterium]
MPDRRKVTRRTLVGAAALAPLAGCATTPEGPTALSSGPFDANPKVIDASSDVRPHLAALKAAGVWTVIRYYARDLQEILPEKRLKREEAADLIAAGFSIAVVYQYFNNVRENINAARGRQDADYAVEHAAVVQKQPKGSAIYFGVDGDWADAAARADIAGYFRSVRGAFEGSGYKIGAYGSGATLAFLEAEGLADMTWLAYPQGWSGSAAYFNANNWRLFQSALETRIGALAIDANIVNPRFADFGQWGAKGVDYGHRAAASSAVAGERRFVAVHGAKLRVAPDEGAAEIATARFRKGACVRILGTGSGWAALDVNESGLRTGYARLADLTPDFSRRPDFFAA